MKTKHEYKLYDFDTKLLIECTECGSMRSVEIIARKEEKMRALKCGVKIFEEITCVECGQGGIR